MLVILSSILFSLWIIILKYTLKELFSDILKINVEGAFMHF